MLIKRRLNVGVGVLDTTNKRYAVHNISKVDLPLTMDLLSNDHSKPLSYMQLELPLSTKEMFECVVEDIMVGGVGEPTKTKYCTEMVMLLFLL